MANFSHTFFASRSQTEAASKKAKSNKVIGFDMFNNVVALHFFATGLRLASRGKKGVAKTGHRTKKD